MSIKNKMTRGVLYCYLLIVVLFVTIRLLSHYGVLSFLGTTGSYIVNGVIQVVFIFSIPALLFPAIMKKTPKETFKFYGFRKISLKAIGISILIGVIVYILNVFVASFFSSIIQSFGYKSSSSSSSSSYPVYLLFINLFTTAVLPAICEETAHRGMLLKGFSVAGRVFAILASSLLFGLLHLNIEQFFFATLIGILVGYISTICDSIYPAMIIHFMNNAISVLMGYSASNNLNFDFLFTFINSNLQTNPVLGILFFISFIGTLIIALRYLIKKLFKETTMKSIGRLQAEIFKEITKQQFLQDLESASNGEDSSKKEVSLSYEKFDELYQSKSKDLGQSTNLETEIMKDQRPYKFDFVSGALLISCFVLTAIVTIFSLIWGILLW